MTMAEALAVTLDSCRFSSFAVKAKAPGLYNGGVGLDE